MMTHITTRNNPAIGSPWHGLVQDGQLPLPNELTMEYPQPAGEPAWFGSYGRTQLVRVPGVEPIERTDEQLSRDSAQGKQWLDYALLSGKNQQLYGQEIGPNHHVYFDENGNGWLVNVLFYPVRIPDSYPGTPLTVHVRATLEAPFGRVPDRYDPIDAVLCSEVFDSGLPWDFPPEAVDGYFFVPDGMRFERSPGGDGLLLHLYRGDSEYTNPEPASAHFPTPLALSSVYRIRFDGNGSLDPQTVGAGITAFCEEYVTYQDVVMYEEIDEPVPYCDEGFRWDRLDGCVSLGPCGGKFDYYTYPNPRIRTSIALLRVVYDSEGNESRVELRETETLQQTWERTYSECTGARDPGYISIYERVGAVTITREILLGGVVKIIAPEWILANHTIQYLANTGPLLIGDVDLNPIADAWQNNSVQLRTTTLGGEVIREEVLPFFESGTHPSESNRGHGYDYSIRAVYVSPQIFAFMLTQGPGGFDDYQVTNRKIGPYCAAEAHIETTHDLPPMDNWWWQINGSYEPMEKQIVLSGADRTCFV